MQNPAPGQLKVYPKAQFQGYRGTSDKGTK